MTINIAVVTSDALVLGCDSIASVTRYLVDPFAVPSEEQPDGSFRLTVKRDDIRPQVTSAVGGVTKMFSLSEGRTPVGAVTAGAAKLNDRSISSYAHEFLNDRGPNPIVLTVEEVANNFLTFMRQHYDVHFAQGALATIPEEYREGPVFLIGGYNSVSHLPSLYRVNVQERWVRSCYAPGVFGIAWAGQSDAVERLIRGYDTLLRGSVETQVTAGIEALRRTMGEAAARMLQAVLDRAQIAMPEGVNTELPQAPRFTIAWEGFTCEIAYGNLPLQDAVDFAAYLVNLQSGKSKFASGVATVGGRTHIGLITKQDGFRLLDEPQIEHTNVGFV